MAKTLTNDKLLERYRDQISCSKRWREDEKYDDTWRRLIDMYMGRQFEEIVGSSENHIAVNISFATINVIYPSISVNHPKTTLMARDPDKADQAVIAEAVLDYWWKTGQVSPNFRQAVKDFLVIGHGWVKVVWRYVEEQVPRDETDMMSEFASKASEADQFAGENPDAHVPSDEDIWQGIDTHDSKVHEDRPCVERVSPADMFVDPEATCMDDLCWIAQRLIRPLEEVQDDERYDPRTRHKVKADLTVNEKWNNKNGVRRANKSEHDKRVTVWEYYNVKKNLVCIFAESGDGFLVKPRKIPYNMGHPFVMMRNYEVPDQFYPLGDLEEIEPLQQELNRTRSQLMNSRQQYARKHLYFRSAFDAAGVAALESTRDGEMVPVLEGARQLQEVVAPLPINPIPPDLFNYSQTILDDINLVTGVSDYQRGAAPEVRRTATEASMIQDAVNARSADKLSIIERGICEIGTKMLGLARQFLTGEQVARIMGKDGAAIWVPYTQEDIDADVDMEVEGGSTQPKNEAWRQQQAMQLLQAIGPMLGQVIDPAAFAKWTLQQFGIKNPDQFLMQQQPMMPGAAPGAPPGAGGGPPPPGGAPDPNAQGAAPGGDGQIPPELAAMLQGGAPPQGGPQDDTPEPGMGVNPDTMPAPPGGPMASGPPPGPPMGAPMDGGMAPQIDPQMIAKMLASGDTSGIPPEILAQLAGQVGLTL